MGKDIKVAIIGLDTSHSIEFPRRMQAPDCPGTNKIEGMRAVSCLRFMTPFTDEKTLNNRQKQLEKWGVKVTDDFNEAISGCDAIMIEINDPAYHLEYFKKCVDLKKPIFLDKPLADTYESGKIIYKLAKEKNVQVMSCSSLRFSQNLVHAIKEVSSPEQAYIYGPLGLPPVGDGIVWYGVHCFEMLQRAMGMGAIAVDVKKDGAGAVAIIDYPEKRRGIIELTVDSYVYGGTLHSHNKNIPFKVDGSMIYTELLKEIFEFFNSGRTSITLEGTLEVMNLLDSAALSYQRGIPINLK